MGLLLLQGRLRESYHLGVTAGPEVFRGAYLL
jgi:hypothetical protein